MKKSNLYILLFFILSISDIYAATPNDTIAGGRLYDKWWKVASNATAPVTNHAKWPASNTTITGADTWRCKECHGWDYQGVDGKYGYADLTDPTTGKHYSGIRGFLPVLPLL